MTDGTLRPFVMPATWREFRISMHLQIDPSVTWEFVAWLRTVTKLPIIVKASGCCPFTH